MWPFGIGVSGNKEVEIFGIFEVFLHTIIGKTTIKARLPSLTAGLGVSSAARRFNIAGRKRLQFHRSISRS
jgi:hypothetical protein